MDADTKLVALALLQIIDEIKDLAQVVLPSDSCRIAFLNKVQGELAAAVLPRT